MALANTVKILEVCHVSPSENASELTLPLSHNDLPFIKEPPSERLFFYEVPDMASSLFFDSLLPNLKKSLSVTLSHYLPLAGNVTWPPHSPRPIIQYTPGDFASFAVAESSDATSFDLLSGDDAFPAINMRPLVPKLATSVAQASTMAIQVTSFRSKGFSIGFTCHHAVLDGQSWTTFMSAWAHICRNSLEVKDFATLVPALSPLFDREVIKDMAGSGSGLFDQLAETDSKTLKLLDETKYSESQLRATFKLTGVDIDNLKKKLLSCQQKFGRETLHLSAFVVTCAYILVCMRKALESEEKKRYYFSFLCDLRSRLKPPVPKNYIGNCVGLGGLVEVEDRDFTEEDGIANLAEKINNEIQQIDEGLTKGAEWWLAKLSPLFGGQGIQSITLAESPKFQVYDINFGWGKPKKVTIVHIDRSATFSLLRNRDDSGGIEAGLVLNKNEMEIFASSFQLGLKLYAQVPE